jgi:hypothetical protein
LIREHRAPATRRIAPTHTIRPAHRVTTLGSERERKTDPHVVSVARGSAKERIAPAAERKQLVESD